MYVEVTEDTYDYGDVGIYEIAAPKDTPSSNNPRYIYAYVGNEKGLRVYGFSKERTRIINDPCGL